jgi:RNA recognition motif-containing protein
MLKKWPELCGCAIAISPRSVVSYPCFVVAAVAAGQKRVPHARVVLLFCACAPKNRAQVRSDSMSKKLFVGGLSWGTTDEGLHAAFSRFGEIVEAKVITDRETGRSRGFGFVTFTADEQAQAAVQEMNNAKLDGRTIRVNEADNQQPMRGGPGGGGGRGGYRNDRGPRRAGAPE